MSLITTEEKLKRKTFAISVFFEYYNKFKKRKLNNENLLTEFETVIVDDAYDILLGLAFNMQVNSLIFDETRCAVLSNAYVNNSKIPELVVLPENNLHFDFICLYLMTQFFISEELVPHENFTLGFRYIKKAENIELYYKFKHSIINEIEQLIFNPKKAIELREKSLVHIPFQRHAKLLSAIKNMDFELFINSYPDVKIYPKNSNKIFAKKLNDIFEILKNEGDTVLNIKDCTSTCDCEDCKKHPDKYIYAFVGNVSANYFALTMYIDRDYQPLLISISRISEFSIDRENNNKTKYDETIIGQNFGTLYSFTILDDELDNFTPTDSYLDLINIKNEAFEELELKNNTINTYDELKDWLTKYNIDNLKSEANYKILQEFNLLYNELNSFYNDCTNINKAKNAMLDFLRQDNNETTRMMQWLMKYEEFYNESCGDLALKLFAEEGEYLNFSLSKEYKLSLSVFEDIVPFLKVFENNYYYEMEQLKSNYLNQQKITLEEYENKRIYIKNELTHFYNLLMQTKLDL